MHKAIEFITKVRVSPSEILKPWFNYNSAPNHVYDEFIKVLRCHEMKEISMEEMNEKINFLLIPYPSLS